MDAVLVSKVQKLLNLATSDVEEEARSAMLKAQALMAANNLSMDHIHAIRPAPDEVIEKTAEKDSKTIQYWHKLLTSVITRNFRCSCLYRSYRNGTRDIVIIGLTQDVEMCHETLTFSFQAAKNCWNRYRRSRTFRTRAATEAAKKDYMVGFAVGLRDAFADQVKEKAIVLTKSQRVDEYVRERAVRREPAMQRNGRVDRHAQAHGYSEGRRGKGGYLEERNRPTP